MRKKVLAKLWLLQRATCRDPNWFRVRPLDTRATHWCIISVVSFRAPSEVIEARGQPATGANPTGCVRGWPLNVELRGFHPATPIKDLRGRDPLDVESCHPPSTRAWDVGQTLSSPAPDAALAHTSPLRAWSADRRIVELPMRSSAFTT